MTNKINLLDSLSKKEKLDLEPVINHQSKNKANRPKKKITFLTVFLLAAIILFFVNINKSNQTSNSWLDNIPIIGQLKHLVESANNPLKGEDRGQINILLLGMGGRNHDGGYLTDTIILLSLEPKTKKVALISIPRDLAVPLEDMGWKKINNVNAFAELKQPGSGGLATSQTLSDILKVPVDYYARVDFTGFVKILNELGGVEVNVPETLDDYKYPIMGNENAPYDQRYEHLHVEQGWQKMDGDLALKYARSRHAAGQEGSDFARAKRQQLILQAVKDKVMSYNILFNPTKIANIINEIKDNFSTNLKIWEMVKLWNMLKNIKDQEVINKVLDDSPEGLLTSSISADGAFILLPRGGDFSEIQYLINNIFGQAPVSDKTKVNQEKPSIEVRNGTWVNGLANKVALDLEKYGFKVIRVGNTSQQNFQKTVIYDLTYGAKVQSLTVLKDLTDGNVALGMPEWLMNDLAKELTKEKTTSPVQPDFIIVLGQAADATKSGAENINQ